MRKRKIKILVFALLTFFVSSNIFLLLLEETLHPVVRKYTVVNNTNENIYITPLMRFGIYGSDGDDFKDIDFARLYVEVITDQLGILSQYLYYQSPPAINTYKRTDVQVKPQSSKVLYIDHGEIRQEEGPQVLLVKNEQGEYYYKFAHYWSRDTIHSISSLYEASESMIESKEDDSFILFLWAFYTVLILIALVFPYFLIRNIRLYRKEIKLKNAESLS